MEDDFFTSQTPSSRTKAVIVADYFPKYCRILNTVSQDQIWYVDLFAGPGKYKDGNHSTPLLLATSIAKDEKLRRIVRLFFNDKEYTDELEKNFKAEFPDGTFVLEPRFGKEIVGESEKILDYLTKKQDSQVNGTPTLLFIDPWGYKGIDTLALAEFLKNWGNELFLFVNTKRINAAIDNGKFDELMLTLFPTSIDQLRLNKKYKASVNDRVKLIIDSLAYEFERAVKKKLFTCAFRFIEEDSIATSHYIIHFTKHVKGYELVKQIYYDYDNIGAPLENGFYTFDAKKMRDDNSLKMNFGDDNVAALSRELLEKYKGRTITAKDLFEQHNTTNQWCASHYAKTLREMVFQGKVISQFTDQVNHKVSVTITDSCILKF